MASLLHTYMHFLSILRSLGTSAVRHLEVHDTMVYLMEALCSSKTVTFVHRVWLNAFSMRHSTTRSRKGEILLTEAMVYVTSTCAATRIMYAQDPP
jgi:hypothetical protein